jgi:predicted deacylase
MAIVRKLKKGDIVQAGDVAFKIISLGEQATKIVITAPPTDKVVFLSPNDENNLRTIEDCRNFAI